MTRRRPLLRTLIEVKMFAQATRLALATVLALSVATLDAKAQGREGRGGGGMVGNRGNGGREAPRPQNVQREAPRPQNVQREAPRPQNVQREVPRPPNNVRPENFRPPNNVRPENFRPQNNVRPENFRPQNNIRPENFRPENNIRPENFRPQNNISRENFGNNIVNRNNYEINRNNYNVNNFGNRPNSGGYGGFGGTGGYGGGGNYGSNWGGYGGYHGNPYFATHQNWVHGSWNGNYGPGWGGYNVGNSFLGLGSAVGLSAWGLSSLGNSWGYSRYSNPYYGSSVAYLQQPGYASSYDYSRPLDIVAPLPDQNVVQTADQALQNARQAFLAGDYPGALARANDALVQTPNDPMLHEFRAICLFAQQRYDQAAIPLYTVLSAGPGWDWTTLIGLYPSVEVYTAQLRGLEGYCDATPQAASARFVLAALYLTQGSPAAAAGRLREVVTLQPQDRLSAQLLAAIGDGSQAPPPQPTPPPNGSGTQDGPPLPTGPLTPNLFAVWTARPAADVTITLALGPGKAFAWKVDEKGQARAFSGEAGLDNEVLALVPPNMPPIVGKLTWRDETHFQFKALGSPNEDPGLEFGR